MEPTNIVKFLVRRGHDSQRATANLAQGELAMITDSGYERLFVGVGGSTTPGGVPVAGKLFFVNGFTLPADQIVLGYVQPHDLVYATSLASLYALSGTNNLSITSYAKIATNN